MGRKLEFNKQDALQCAMESFWVKGYDATSMRDLASKLGLHLGSVYNALGDKGKVFEDALRLHFKMHKLPALQELADSADPLQALREMIDQTLEECNNDAPGCFLVNSLLEINSINDNISTALQEYMSETQRYFTICIRRGMDAGLISKEKTAEQLAHFMISTCVALRAMAKLGAPQAYMRDIADCALSTLTTPSGSAPVLAKKQTL